MTQCIQSFTPAPLSAFSKDLPCLRIWQALAPGSECQPWHCLMSTESTARHAFTWQQRNSRSRRTSARKSPPIFRHRGTLRLRSGQAPEHGVKLLGAGLPFFDEDGLTGWLLVVYATVVILGRSTKSLEQRQLRLRSKVKRALDGSFLGPAS